MPGGITRRDTPATSPTPRPDATRLMMVCTCMASCATCGTKPENWQRIIASALSPGTLSAGYMMKGSPAASDSAMASWAASGLFSDTASTKSSRSSGRISNPLGLSTG